MEGLSHLAADLYVLDPDKEGVRYDVVHQIAHSYALVNRSRGKVLSFVAEGPDAEKARRLAVEVFTLPWKELLVKYANLSAYKKVFALKQIPHETERIPELPGPFGPLVRLMYEFGGAFNDPSRPQTIAEQLKAWGLHALADIHEKEMNRHLNSTSSSTLEQSWNDSPWNDTSWR